MSTNAEIIAKLREEKRAAVESAAYWEREHDRERKQRQLEVGAQEYRGNTVSYIYDKERNYGAHFDRMNREIATLVKAGNALAEYLRPGPIPTAEPTERDFLLADWEAAQPAKRP